MNILLLDNYDSFTYNLLHYLEAEQAMVHTVRNDEITLEDALQFDALVLSPGPGLPKEAGIMMDLLHAWPEDKPVLGVCLGLQAIVERFGGSLKNLEKVIHGQATWATHDEQDNLFHNVPQCFQVGHYHSWAADTLSNQLVASAQNENGIIMAVRHIHLPIRGVQFHPESVLTPDGRTMIRNWVEALNNRTT